MSTELIKYDESVDNKQSRCMALGLSSNQSYSDHDDI